MSMYCKCYVLILLYLSLIYGTDALHCYECTGQLNSGCGIIFDQVATAEEINVVKCGQG